METRLHDGVCENSARELRKAASRKHILNALCSFSESEKRELKQVFETLDENKDGHLSPAELSSWMSRLGLRFTEDGMVRLVRAALPDQGPDAPVSLNFGQFVKFNRSLAEPDAMVLGEEEEEEGKGNGEKPKKSDMEEAFALFDKNGDGLISACELGETLASLGLLEDGKLSQWKSMIKRVDKDGDEHVNFSEFQAMMATNTL